jgi:hypothetical protein
VQREALEVDRRHRLGRADLLAARPAAQVVPAGCGAVEGQNDAQGAGGGGDRDLGAARGVFPRSSL